MRIVKMLLVMRICTSLPLNLFTVAEKEAESDCDIVGFAVFVSGSALPSLERIQELLLVVAESREGSEGGRSGRLEAVRHFRDSSGQTLILNLPKSWRRTSCKFLEKTLTREV